MSLEIPAMIEIVSFAEKKSVLHNLGITLNNITGTSRKVEKENLYLFTLKPTQQ